MPCGRPGSSRTSAQPVTLTAEEIELRAPPPPPPPPLLLPLPLPLPTQRTVCPGAGECSGPSRKPPGGTTCCPGSSTIDTLVARADAASAPSSCASCCAVLANECFSGSTVSVTDDAVGLLSATCAAAGKAKPNKTADHSSNRMDTACPCPAQWWLTTGAGVSWPPLPRQRTVTRRTAAAATE